MCWQNKADLMRRLKILIAFLIPVAAVMVMNNGLDNDSWYVIAEGREIVENGIYYEDQLSMHEGLEVTVQNYGFAAIFYLLFLAFGGVGIYIAMLIANVILCYLIYKICMLLSNKNMNLSLLLMILTDLLLVNSGFIVTRAQMISYAILMLVIYLLELYIRKGKTKTLWWIPILSVIQINLHASVWPMMLIVMVVYMLDARKQPKLHYKGYKMMPILRVLILAILVGFLNPYGIKMMTYILTSYGIPEANDYINEMAPFSLGSNRDILFYGAIVAVMMLYVFGKNRNIRMRYLILLFGFLALGINTVKGMSYLILVLWFPIAEVYRDARIGRWGTRKIRWMVGSWMGVIVVGTVLGHIILTVPNVNSDGPFEGMVVAVDYLDLAAGEADKEHLKVYADYNQGGFLEYRGYKPYIDPRMETFLKANNGKDDIFLEYYKLEMGKLNKAEFIKKYDFDYLVVGESDALYDFPEIFTDKYKMIYEDDDDEKYGVRVYQKIDNTKEMFKM